MKQPPLTNGTPHPLWVAAQAVGITATLALVLGLFLLPEPSLNLLWNAAVPVLPVVFLLNPALWRNVCPLATLNVFTGKLMGSRRREDDEMRRWSGVAILLLLAMVPARRLLFNHDGPVLAVTILTIALLAMLMGVFYTHKSGFCNAICPIVPVERLYGQSPLLEIGNPRCQPCVWCTVAGCTDKAPYTAIDELVGPVSGARWLLTPFGAFAVAFPGFVVGYFLLDDGALGDTLRVYATVAMGMASSYVIFAGIAVFGGVARWRLIRLAAALAISLYYWMGAPAIATAWDLPGAFVVGVRLFTLTLVGVWLWKAPREA